MYGYIYMTTNLLNGKKYIGKKSKSYFVPSYLGSGNELWKDIDKFGRNNFKVEIIDDTANTEEELCELEKFYIKKYNAVESSEFYNIAEGGNGGRIYKVHPKGFKGKKHSENTKRIQAETIKNFVNDRKLNTNWKNGHPRGFKGKKHTEESNMKRKKSNYDSYYNFMSVKVIMPNGDIKYFKSRDEAVDYLKISYFLFDKLIKSGEQYTLHKNTRHNRDYLKTLEGLIILKSENSEVND